MKDKILRVIYAKLGVTMFERIYPGTMNSTTAEDLANAIMEVVQDAEAAGYERGRKEAREESK